MSGQPFDPSPTRGSPERLNIRLRVLFSRSGRGFGFFVPAESANVGADGIFIRTHRRPLDVGTKVAVLFEREDFHRELMLAGVVVWVSEGESSDAKTMPRGMGIRFEHDGDSRKILRRSLDELKEGSRPSGRDGSIQPAPGQS